MLCVFPPADNTPGVVQKLQTLRPELEECFDRTTKLAIDSLDVTASVISLLDEDRQWITSRAGFDWADGNVARELRARTLASDDPVIVLDTADDGCIAAAESANIRFYAGVALSAIPGVRIGTLCVMDRLPRTSFASGQIRVLQNLASLAENFLKMLRMDERLSEAHAALRDTERTGRRAEQRYRQLFDHNPLPVFVFDASTLRILALNDAAERAYGYSRDELLGDSITVLRSEEDRARVEAFLRQIKAFPFRSVPFKHVSKHGKIVHAEATIDAIDFDGRPARIAIINDVTEITRAQGELRTALRAAEEASRAKSLFLATMSHEIRTPMNGVIGMTSLLLNTDLNSEQQEYVETIRSSGEVLLNIINDVLDFSKIESGRLEFENVPLELKAVLRQVVSLTATSAAAKGLDLRIELAPDTPRSVTGDPGRLTQILLNLISNAIKFTESGHITLSVHPCESTAEMRVMSFAVRDTGIGIAPEKLSQLFEPFTQADASTTRRFGGTGLGLSIAKRLVELMGGRIGCHSTVGQGSTFWFTLPMAHSVPPKTVNMTVAEEIDRGPLKLRDAALRVLLAEDNSVNQRLVLHLLRRLGHVVDVVVNGREAVEAFRRFPYKLILMDSQMPELDGFEATRQIREIEGPLRKTVIISITASVLHHDRSDAISAGMDDYISKPVNTRLFEERMRHWAAVIENKTDDTSVPEMSLS